MRRLFQNLQKRVGAEIVELIDRIDNGDAPAALARGRAEERHRAAHILDRDILPQFAFVVERSLQRQQIAVGFVGDAARDRIVRIDRERSGLLHVRCGGVGMRQDETRQPIRQSGLADAARPADQPGVRHAAAAIALEQGLLRVGVADQAAVLARMQDVGFAIVCHRRLMARLGGAAQAAAAGAASSPRPRCPIAPLLSSLSRQSGRSAAARLRRARHRRGAAPRENSAPRLQNGRLLHRRAAATARLSPTSGGTSRMMVRSGRRSPTVTRSSPLIRRSSTLPSAP